VNATDNVVSKTRGGSATTPAPLPGSDRRVIRVWVVDDNAALRDLFVQLLNQQPGIRCRRQFPSAEAVLATLAEERPPDIILLDVNLGSESGLSAIRPIRKLAPSVKVLMLTMFSNSHYEVEAFRAGASGFLLKSYELHEIVRLIHEAQHRPDCPNLFPNMALHKQSEMELEVLEAGTRAGRKPPALMRALRQLWGGSRRGAAA